MPEPVYVTYFTDPLCSWCWAFESSWRWLLSQFPGRLRYRYRMGGMLADWRRYQDPLNNVNKPGQMGPQWLEVQKQTGVLLNPELWHRNPPASSYPACIAYKAAEMLRVDFAEFYLRRLREAALLEARDISQQDVLIAVAEETLADLEDSDAISREDFLSALESPEAETAFREDLKEVRFMEIGRFPTVIFHRPGSRGLALTGYRPSAALCEGLSRFAPELVPPQYQPEPLAVDDLKAYITRWRRVTREELMQNFALPRESLEAELERLGQSLAVMEAENEPLTNPLPSTSPSESPIRWENRPFSPSNPVQK